MNTLQTAFAAVAAAGILSLATPAPALADGAASTRNILLGAAAIAGIAIESNVARKHTQANSISGYLPDGSAVYGDGHVVNRNGYTYYPSKNGQTISCSNGNCNLAYTNNQNGNGYYSNYNGYANNNGVYPGYNGNNNPNNNRNWNARRDHPDDDNENR